MKLKLAPKLQPLPELGTHQITASQLATNGIGADGEASMYMSDHIGRTIAVRKNGTIIAGPLQGVFDSASSKTRIVLEIGEFRVGLHPTHPVTVAPEGHRLTVVAKPKPDPEAP